MGTERNNSTNLLYPPFRLLVTTALEAAYKQNLYAYLFEGWRSTERQAYLYAQGRSTPGKIVTWARPGDSFHQYGVAGDFVFDRDPSTKAIEWTWEGGYADENGDNYDKLAKILKSYGLEWLGDSNTERAHFQMSYGLTIKEMKLIADAKGVLGLWQEFDKRLGGKK